MISQDQMRRVLTEHVEAENTHDVDGVLATYSRNGAAFEDVPAGARYLGGAEIIGNYRHLWDGFPGLGREITRWTFSDDAAVIELTLSGRHKGPFRGILPTGRDIQLRIIAHFQFDDEGRIAQETAYYDTLTFMRQLGITGS